MSASAVGLNSRIKVRLLGPVGLVGEGGTLVDLGARKQRAMFALLVLARGRLVTVDRMVDELWGGADPARALASLYPCMSKLRRSVDAGMLLGDSSDPIASVSSGYLLRIDPGAVDGFVFESLAAEVSTCASSGRFDEVERIAPRALGLWQGVALGEFAHEPFASAEAGRFEHLRLGVIEDLFEARLMRGDSALGADVERFVADHPYRERAWGLLFRAMYFDGRQSDALRAYERLRLSLRAELGIAPGAELQELQRLILAHELPARREAAGEVAVALPPPMPQAVPEPDSVLVGRDAELSVVASAVDDALLGSPRCLVFVGDAGIGKSRMVKTVVDNALRRGFRVAQGFCDDDGTPPFGPWSAILDLLGLGDVEEMSSRLESSARANAADVDAAQRRLIDELIGRIRLVAVEGPLLVVVEDLHWADAASLRCFEQLVRQVTTGRVLVIGTCRENSQMGASRMLGGLVRSAGVERVALSGLSRSEIEVAAGMQSARQFSARELDVIEQRTLGNPFFVLQVVRSVGADGSVDASVPLAVADVVGRRLAELPNHAGNVLTVAAVIGSSFDLGLLADVAGVESNDVFDAVDVAVLSGLVEPTGDVVGRFRFVHAIVRDALLEGVLPLRRARIHERIATLLAAENARSPDLWLHRWEARSVVPDLARWACREAALAAERTFATEDASRWWERALQLEPSGSAQRAGLLLAYGKSLTAFPLLEDHPASATGAQRTAEASAASVGTTRPRSWPSLLEAIDLGLSARDLEVAGSAAIAIGASSGSWPWCGFREDDSDVNRRLEAVLAQLEPSDQAMRAAVLANLAVGHYNDADPTISDVLSAEAVKLARQLGDRTLLVNALLSRSMAIERPDREPERLQIVTDTLALDPPAPKCLSALLMRAAILLRAGSRTGAEADLAEVTRIARHERLWAEAIEAQAFHATLALLSGDLAVAESLATDVIERSASQLSNRVALGFLGLYSMWSAQGKLGDAELPARRFGQLFGIPDVDLVGPVLLAQGRVDDAAQLALDPDAWTDPPHDWFWLSQNVLRARVAAATRNEALARRQYALLAPHAGTVVVRPTYAVHGLVDAYLGNLARTWGDDEAAAAHHRNAAELAESVGAERWLAESLTVLDELGGATGNR